MDQRLIEAAQSGSIDVLYDLIHEDPYVLENIDEVPFVHTPLHIAAECGRTTFAMEMMNLKPSFARKLNTNGFSPLHLALENDHAQCALELLKVDPSLVRVRGRQGMTPMHLVVTKGNIRILTEFLLACTDCLRDVNVKGQTSLHIAVMNDRYEELKVLIGCIERMSQKGAWLLESQLVNRRDQDGNTALHLAAYEDKPQVIRLLLNARPVNLNVKNREGLTLLDILQTRRPCVYTDIEKIIRKSGGKNASSMPEIKTNSELGSPVTFLQYWSTYWARCRSRTSDGTSNALLVIATLIITTTYQTALQPPGGVHQADSSTGAGTVVMNSNYFQALWISNAMAIWTGMCTIYVILPGGADYILWFLSILVPLYVSYIVSWCVISPESSWYLITTSAALLVFILMIYLMLFFSWKRSKK